MSDLKRVIKLAEVLAEQQARVKRLDEELKEAKKEANRTEREDLPALMSELGVQELTLEDGQKVRIKEEVDARITDKTRPAALQWLRENNFSGLIKTNVSVFFPNGEHEEAERAREALAERYEGVTMEERVHPATLKAFVKEQMSTGAGVPMDLFNVYPYSKAVITKK